MNEHDLAKKFTQHLDYGTANLDSRVQYRLQTARQHALDAYAKPQHGFGLAWGHAGNGGSRHGSHSPFRTWLPLIALLLGLVFVTFWQNVQQTSDISEIDAYLLAEDLPLHAFIDNGFDTWLEGSSQE